MFSLKLESDYHSNYKADMVNYLKGDMPRKNLNKDFISFLEKIDEIEDKIREVNDCFMSLQKKYMLLFALRDFRNLFKDSQLKEEMLRYMEYKESIEDNNEVLSS